MAAIKRFLEEFDGKKTQANYATFAPKHGLPSISRFENFGGWSKLRQQAENQL